MDKQSVQEQAREVLHNVTVLLAKHEIDNPTLAKDITIMIAGYMRSEAKKGRRLHEDSLRRVKDDTIKSSVDAFNMGVQHQKESEA